MFEDLITQCLTDESPPTSSVSGELPSYKHKELSGAAVRYVSWLLQTVLLCMCTFRHPFLHICQIFLILLRLSSNFGTSYFVMKIDSFFRLSSVFMGKFARCLLDYTESAFSEVAVICNLI